MKRFETEAEYAHEDGEYRVTSLKKGNRIIVRIGNMVIDLSHDFNDQATAYLYPYDKKKPYSFLVYGEKNEILGYGRKEEKQPSTKGLSSLLKLN